MVLEKENKQAGHLNQMGLKVRFTTLQKNQEEVIDISPIRLLVIDKMGVGKMKVKGIEGNFKYDLGDVKDEESDTEDSCELEITPEQLSQVVPGGGVLKIKLSKKKPLKITAGASNGGPEPDQTKVKTVQDPINERNDNPLLEQQPKVMFGAKQL